MSINQDIRFRQPDANDPNNPEGFYQSILNLKPAFNMLSGSGPPSPSLGSEGATYIDTLNNTEYLKKEGVWETFFTFSSGTITTGANLGGEGVIDSVLGSSLVFKGLTAGTNVSLINNANDIVINSTAGGTLTNGASTGVGAGVFLNTYYGLNQLTTTLLVGATLVLKIHLNAGETLRFMEAERITGLGGAGALVGGSTDTERTAAQIGPRNGLSTS